MGEIENPLRDFPQLLAENEKVRCVCFKGSFAMLISRALKCDA